MPTPSKQPFARRDFVKAAVLLSALAGRSTEAEPPSARAQTARPCLFTKPLGNRTVEKLPAILHELGVNAIDLTCRAGGHVLPERAADDLPAAMELFRTAGITVPMITTGITDAAEPHAEAIIRTAGQLGIRYVKPGYYPYGDLRRILPRVAEVKARLRDLAALCVSHKVHLGFHTHSGANVGAALWDAWAVLEGVPAESAGCYYDLRHATVEGGDRGWEIGLNLLAPRITLLAVKDFIWAKQEKGGWKPQDVPLGTGMCRHDQALARMKEMKFAGPVSLHCEYCSPSIAVGSDADRQALVHIRNDWQNLGGLLRKAGLA